MIPKVINYCWFGGKEKPKEVVKCIESWKKFCPDYEIIEWNETNYDINKNEYTKRTYEGKKWAFFTDYARLDIIYEYGGIYLDTDVELIKSLDDLLNCEGYMGMEQIGTVATGLGFGAIKNHPFIKKNKEFFENEKNIISNDGHLYKIICVKITTKLLKAEGLKDENKIQKISDLVIYPPDYFCPLKMGTNKLNITLNTYSIHHYSATWKSENRIIRKISYRLIPFKIFIKKILRME